ncbi:hypothetical protein MTO96_015657 [Rhipicephalus appendiculatus]
MKLRLPRFLQRTAFIFRRSGDGTHTARMAALLTARSIHEAARPATACAYAERRDIWRARRFPESWVLVRYTSSAPQRHCGTSEMGLWVPSTRVARLVTPAISPCHLAKRNR